MVGLLLMRIFLGAASDLPAIFLVGCWSTGTGRLGAAVGGSGQLRMGFVASLVTSVRHAPTHKNLVYMTATHLEWMHLFVNTVRTVGSYTHIDSQLPIIFLFFSARQCRHRIVLVLSATTLVLT